MSIPMVDPAGEYRALKAEIDAAVGRVLGSGRFVLGPEGEALERELAAFLGASHAVGVNSGTDALHLPLVAAGIGPGDEVVIPGFTFFATGEAVSYGRDAGVRRCGRGHLQPRSLLRSPGTSRRKRRPSSRSIFLASARSRPDCTNSARRKSCPGRRLRAVHRRRLRRQASRELGRLRRVFVLSHQELAAAGDAGMISAKNEDHAKTLRMLRHHGSRQTYLHERVGWNSRLDELQAAVLRVKLKHLARFNEARRAVARRYREKLAGGVLLPVEHGRGTHVYHQFTIRAERRDAIREALAKEGIASSVFYPAPLHQQPAYAGIAKGVSLPVAEEVAKSVLSLPIHPLLDEASIDRIAACVRAAA